jgi:hypothetical protein
MPAKHSGSAVSFTTPCKNTDSGIFSCRNETAPMMKNAFGRQGFSTLSVSALPIDRHGMELAK